MKGYSQLRKGRSSAPDITYHLTFATDQRVSYFAHFDTARKIITYMQYCDLQNWSNTIAFVVMPDHIHWLLQPNNKNISELVRIVKEQSRKKLKVHWQKGFYDRAMRSEQEAIDVARYIIANPKRAGLVTSVSDYPHWDCIFL